MTLEYTPAEILTQAVNGGFCIASNSVCKLDNQYPFGNKLFAKSKLLPLFLDPGHSGVYSIDFQKNNFNFSDTQCVTSK